MKRQFIRKKCFLNTSKLNLSTSVKTLLIILFFGFTFAYSQNEIVTENTLSGIGTYSQGTATTTASLLPPQSPTLININYKIIST